MEQWLANPEKITVVGMLIVGIIALVRPWVIPLPIHRWIVDDLKQRLIDQKAECEEWKDLARQGTSLTEHSLRIAEKAKHQP